jgi:uncharacterized protein (DUF58 family)
MGQFSTFILVLLFIAFLLRVDFIYYIIYVCVGLYAWSRWYTPRALRGLSTGRLFNSHAFWGEIVPVTIRLENRNRLPLPWVQFTESMAIELSMGRQVSQAISLNRGEAADFTYYVKARRRGYYQLGPLRLATGDLFGLSAERQGALPAAYLTVYPRLTPLSHLGLPSRLPFGTVASRQRLFEDPARPMGVRDYRSGDSLRQINWKVSAHTRDLVVKTFQPAISLETAVLLNLYSDDYSRPTRQIYSEWAVEVAASLAVHLVDQRQPVGLLTNGLDPLAGQGETEFDPYSGRLARQAVTQQGNLSAYLPPAILPRPGRAHLMKILETLARLEADVTLPFHQWAPIACLGLSWGVTVLAITPQGDELTCQMLHRFVRAGFNPVLLVVEPMAHFGQVRQRARRLGFMAYLVAQEEDLAPWRRRQQGGQP